MPANDSKGKVRQTVAKSQAYSLNRQTELKRCGRQTVVTQIQVRLSKTGKTARTDENMQYYNYLAENKGNWWV